jgi:hypothetical protein
MMAKWIQHATEKMKAKGTLGKFGKATPKKIAAAKKKGGKAEKRAIFAQNMKKIAQKHKLARRRLGGKKKMQSRTKRVGARKRA